MLKIHRCDFIIKIRCRDENIKQQYDTDIILYFRIYYDATDPCQTFDMDVTGSIACTFMYIKMIYWRYTSNNFDTIRIIATSRVSTIYFFISLNKPNIVLLYNIIFFKSRECFPIKPRQFKYFSKRKN